MKYFTSILALCVTLFAQTLRAENTIDLEYLQYSIKDKTGTPVTAPADGVEALALNTPEKILFVRNKENKVDASYYIAVFELTRAQASTLGWTSSNENAAFGAITNTQDNRLAAPLAYPTVTQWRAYVEETIARDCNVNGGTNQDDTPMSTEDWQSDYLAFGKSYCNKYGLYDTYGNVAEAALKDDGSILFQGWYATYDFSFDTLETKTLDNLQVLAKDLKPHAFLQTPPAGVRPIYFPPEERVYTVTVTLNGEEIPELKKEAVKIGESVTLPPLTLQDGAILEDGYTVTPETLEITPDVDGNLTFVMPAENVTFAYTSFYQAQITVIDGTTDKAFVKAGETFTISASNEGTFLYWEGPNDLITEENKGEKTITLSIPVIEKTETITFTAKFEPRATLVVENATADKTIISAGDTVKVTATERGFSHWEGFGITATNKTDLPLTFKVQSVNDRETVTLKAIYKPKATITVINGQSSAPDAYSDEQITLTANETIDTAFSHWTGPYGLTDSNKTKTPLTINLDQLTADANVTYEAHYKSVAHLEVVNGAASPIVTTVSKGDEITIKSIYNERSFSHWEGDFVTNYNKNNDPIMLTIGNVAEGQTVTIIAIQKPLATINVIQGASSEETVYKGESFTLIAAIPEGKAFSHWTGPYGITETNQTRNPLEINLDGITKDEMLTYEAHVKDYPRVLVFGGFVELENGVNDRGDGYYNVDARMTITPYDNAPKGYEFSHWLKNNQTKITTKEYTFRVEGLGTVNTFEAIYKVSIPINEDVIHIGAVSETDLTTRTTIGYVAGAVKTLSYDNNQIVFYDTVDAPGDYAVLDLVKKTISMDSITEANVTEANSEENRLNALVMKRPAGQCYYVGIHEVTNAQYDRVVKGGATPDPENGLYPHTTTNTTRAEANTFMTRLSQMFGLTFEKPTKTQIETISTGAKNYMGYGDSAINDTMVNSKEDGLGALAPSGAQAVDPYGFYDLWGNAAESLKGDDANLWGGYYDADFQYCNMKSSVSAKLMINPGAIRPAIIIPTRCKVTVTNVDYTTNVFPGQTITLKKQVREGCQFKNWTVTAGGKTTTYAATSMPQTLTITEDTTLTANFYDPLELVTISYTGDCIGAVSAYPGTTIKVYPTTFGKELKNLTVSPATAATVDLANETITLAENVTGSVFISTTSQTEAQVQITFDANGGTGDTTATQTVGTALTAPIVTREGYTFTGWSPTLPETVPTTDTTYSAQWQVNQYTITFDANGGVGGKAVTQDYGSALVAPTVTRTGYTFTGWSPAVSTTVPAENKTYTAQWKSTTSDDEEHYPEFDDVEKVNINNLVFTIKSNKITIDGYNGTLEGWLDIPETIKGLNVVAISDNAFQNQKKLVYVTLPKTLTSIGKNAFFGCTALDVNKVKLPTGFKKLGKSAFTNCKVTHEVIAVPGEPIASAQFDEAKGYKLATTTSGVKLNSKTGAITATIKKPGTYDIVLFKADAKLKMTRITIKEFVKVAITIEGSDGGCTVKGEGDYLYGKKVTLTAKASKNRIFDGFYYADGSLFSKGLNTSWTMKNEDLNLIARFKTENITIDVAKFAQTQWYVGQSYTLPLSIIADSGVKSVKAKLPKGLKLVKIKDGPWQITGSPKKVGDYTMSFTVTTTQKQTKTEVLPITVHKENVIYDLSAVQDLTLHVGELSSSATISASAFSDIKSIKASKLPSGMKIQKVGENLWQLTGAPKKAGTYTVTLTITTKANTKVTETITLIVALVPDWAAKTFNGEVCNIWDDGGFETSIIAQVTVSSTGEVDGGIYFEDGSCALLDSTAKLLESSANKVRLQLVVPWFDAEGKADGKVKTDLIIQNNNGAVTLTYQDTTKGSSVTGKLSAE